jgi:predicted secreted hydrolase
MAQAGAVAEPFSAWLDDWSLQSTGSDWLPLQATFREGEMGFSLNLDSSLPLVLQGESGFSQKHASGSGSYYYSQPFLQADGHLTIDGEDIAVTGQAWLDREWSSQFLQPGQVGWDWFALHLDSGEKLMLFRLREDSTDRKGNDFQHGVLITPQGDKRILDGTQIAFEVLESTDLYGRTLPMRWRIRLPEIEREMQIRPILQDQWMNLDFAYWEGAVEVSGDTAGTSGRGYLEMTGYPATD